MQEYLRKLTALRPNYQDRRYNVLCHDDWHQKYCQDRSKAIWVEEVNCVEDDIEAARRGIHKMKRRHLIKECALYPARAQKLRTLDGISQRRPVLDNLQVDHFCLL